MATHFDVARIRQTLGRRDWTVPEIFTDAEKGDGWLIDKVDGTARIIITHFINRGNDWIHASISHKNYMPTYDDLVLLHKAIWRGTGWSYQCFVPDKEHINLHSYALHLWGRLDGRPELPDFINDMVAEGYARGI